MFRLWNTTLALSLLCVTVTARPASAGTFETRLDQQIVISGQVFDGSTLELSPVAQGNTHALLLDGRTVALVFRHAVDRCPPSARNPRLFWSSDRMGRIHLVGIRWIDRDSGRIEQRPFRFASVARGIATAPASDTIAREGSR